MALKQVKIKISLYNAVIDGIPPLIVEGEHKATLINFEIDKDLFESLQNESKISGGKLFYRIDTFNAFNEKITLPQKSLDSADINMPIEEWLTRYGGKIKIVFAVTMIKKFNTEIELLSLPVTLHVKELPNGIEKDAETKESVTTLAESSKLSADLAKEAANIAESERLKSEAAANKSLQTEARVKVSAGIAADNAEKAQKSEANAKASAEDADAAVFRANTAKNIAGEAAEQANNCATGAARSAQEAKSSEDNAKLSERNAALAAQSAQDNAERTDCAIAGKADITYVDGNFTNALKTKVDGTAITVNEVSPIDHNIVCTLENVNIMQNYSLNPGQSVGFHINGYDIKKGETITICLDKPVKGLYIGNFKEYTEIAYAFDSASLTYTADIDRKIWVFTNNTGVALNKIWAVKGSVAAPYTPYIPDLTQVKVSEYGKNILAESMKPFGAAKLQINKPIKVNRHTSYALSFEGATSEVHFSVLASDGTSTDTGKQLAGDAVSFNSGDNDYVWFRTWKDNSEYGITGANKCQMEIGTVPTPYEDYREPIDFTPAADGTIAAAKSIAPNMTWLSDNEGVLLTVVYNRDNNKVIANQQKQIDELKQALLTIGGNTNV